MNGPGHLTVITAGLSTMVQDLGRFGYGRFGLAPSGAMDAAALRWSNLLVGNEPGEAALEFNQLGPVLRWDGSEPLLVALAGADFAATVGETPVPPWRSLRLQPGAVLRLGACRAGMYGYLAVAGGVAVPLAFGSRATDPRGNIGGVEGRALRDGDPIPVGATTTTVHGCLVLPEGRRPVYGAPVTVRIVLGTQDERFTEEAIVSLLSEPYRVTREVDRMGVRLDGTPLTFKDPVAGADILSEGVATGAIQVPSHGLPIVLLNARQTTGGYSKIATVIEADIAAVAQARPGAMVNFRRVSLVEARQALIDYRARFSAEQLMSFADADATDAPGGGAHMAATTGAEPEQEPAMVDVSAWSPSALRALLDRIAALGYSEFAFTTADVRIHARREPVAPERGDDVPPPTAEVPPGAARALARESVTAPFLGIFYAAGREGDEPFARLGDVVERGQTLGLIEVMKTFHPIAAPVRGRVARVEVEDGQPVQFGQVLFELEPLPAVEEAGAP